jgi:hypothetical protein
MVATWSPPVLVNDDGKPAEHGFVSLWPRRATRSAWPGWMAANRPAKTNPPATPRIHEHDGTTVQ